MAALSMLNTRSQKEWIPYTLLGLLVIALWIPRIHGPIDLRWDGAVYYVLGTSLAEGKGYRLLNEPGEIQANQYPPLLPLIIAGYQLMLGTSDPLVVGPVLRLSSFIAFSTYIFAVYTFLRGHLSSIYAFFGTVVCLLSVHTYFLSDLCFPDMLYGLSTVGFLLAFSDDKRWSSPSFGGVLAITAFALRTAGIALLVAWIGEGIVRKSWKAVAIRAAIAVVPVLGWFAYVYSVEASVGYQRPAYTYQRADYMFYNVSYARNVSLTDPFDPGLGYSTIQDLAERYAHNVVKMTRSIGESISSMRRVWDIEWEKLSSQLGFEAGPPWIVNVPLFALGFLVLVGTGILAMQGYTIIILCIFSSLAVMCLTPWPEQFTRYLMPTVPVLALSLCTTLVWLLKQSREHPSLCKWRTGIRILVCLLMVGIGLQQTATTWSVYASRHLPVLYHTREGDAVAYRLFFYMDSYRALDAGVDWLMLHAKPTDVIAVSMPHWVHLRTGNKTVMPPFESDPIKAETLLQSVPVAYLILDEGLAIDSKRFTKGIVERFPEHWKRVYSDDIVTETGARHEQAFAIYERIPPGSVIVPPETAEERHEAG